MPSTFEVRDAPGKGRGLFAKQNIKTGADILREDVFVYSFRKRKKVGEKDGGKDGPAMCKYPYERDDWKSPEEYQELKKKEKQDRDIETSLESFLTELVPNDAEQIRRRNKLYPGLSELVNIFMTNRVPVNSGFDSMGLGVQSSLINHSCIPNAYTYGGWFNRRPKRAKLSIKAVKDIEAGEEITVAYLLFDAPVKNRRQEVHDTFKFKCRCDTCEVATAKTNDLFKQLADAKVQLRRHIRHANRPQDACHFFRWAHTFVDLMGKLEISDVRMNYFWMECARVAAIQRDVPRTSRFITYYHEWWQKAAPSNFPEIVAGGNQDAPLKSDPRNHPAWPEEGKNDPIDVKSLLPQDYAAAKYHLFMTGYADEDAYYIAIKGRDKGFYQETQDYIERPHRERAVELIEEMDAVKLDPSEVGAKVDKAKKKKTKKPAAKAATSKTMAVAEAPLATDVEIESLNTGTADGDEGGFKEVQGKKRG